MNTLTRPYIYPIILFSSILLGGLNGYWLGDKTLYLKPIGSFFLNLILATVVPLVFFSVSSSIEKMISSRQISKVAGGMVAAFLFTGVSAACYMIIIMKFFPPAGDLDLNLGTPDNLDSLTASVNSSFVELLSHLNMLHLIFFSILAGIIVSRLGKKRRAISAVLESGNAFFMKLVTLIMYLAPVGFFAYFAVLVNELGPKVLGTYLHVTILYYSFTLLYFIIMLSFFAWVAGKREGIKRFWKNIHLPALTSLATCSSAASIPANMQAMKNAGMSAAIYESVIPLGTFLHKEGSILGAIVKIAFLYSLFHLPFSGIGVLLMAIVISLLVGTVMGAIPGGGMLGEMLILSAFGFPPQCLLVIAAIGIIIDPLATMINVTGNGVNAMLVARWVEGRKWLDQPVT